MLYALTVPRLNAIFFLEERPGEDLGEVRDGVTLEVPPDYAGWADEEEPPDEVLCTSARDPAHYRVFKHLRDVDPAAFRPTHKSFGGVYSPSAWAALRAAHPALRGAP